MSAFHSHTFKLLECAPPESPTARAAVEKTEHRLGIRLPASVREWYSIDDAIDILAKYSNDDRPIALQEFALNEWESHRLLPFKIENQGVCVWAISIDASDDPAVYVDVDSNGAQWNMMAPTFSSYIYACVWDYVRVLHQQALVQAQNEPLSSGALEAVREWYDEEPATFSWPGNTQYRFAGDGHAILIWAGDDQADWFIGAREASALENALRRIWDVDHVGRSLYDCDEIGDVVLKKIRGEA